MAAPTDKPDENFYIASSSFWQNYVKGRPQPPEAFFKQIFDYHAEHNGHFNVVHDAGAGAGVHSRKLAERFTRVILTDPSESNIAAAKSLLSEDSKFDFHQCKLEESDAIPDNFLDMVFAATMIHWTNADEALRQIVRQLKPNGTLIVALFAFPRFPSEPKLQSAWDAIVHKVVADWKASATDLKYWKETCVMQATGYDRLGLNPEIWESVERWKVNDKDDPAGGAWRNMFVPPSLAKELPNDVRIGKGEKVVYKEDEEWMFEGDWEFVRANLNSMPMDFEGPSLKPLVDKMRAELPDGKVVKGTWPMTLIMATKK